MNPEEEMNKPLKIPKVEQIDRAESGKKARSWWKKILNRRERRFAKLHPEDAPTKHNYRGYTL